MEYGPGSQSCKKSSGRFRQRKSFSSPAWRPPKRLVKSLPSCCHTLVDCRTGKTELLLKPGINSQFVIYYRLSRNSFLSVLLFLSCSCWSAIGEAHSTTGPWNLATLYRP